MSQNPENRAGGARLIGLLYIYFWVVSVFALFRIHFAFMTGCVKFPGQAET